MTLFVLNKGPRGSEMDHLVCVDDSKVSSFIVSRCQSKGSIVMGSSVHSSGHPSVRRQFCSPRKMSPLIGTVFENTSHAVT